MQLDHLAFLRLTQLADSALPIGSTAHSFGLETLVATGALTVACLPAFLHDYLCEAGALEAIFVRLAHRLSTSTLSDSDTALFPAQWLALNDYLGALKTARESRTASSTLGRRFLQLVSTLEPLSLLALAQQTAKTAESSTHYAPAFGLVGGILAVDETTSVLAYLHQSLLGLVSACQRLLPLGQHQASSIIWQLNPTLLEVAFSTDKSDLDLTSIQIFTPLGDIGSMSHPQLPTRLFIS